MWVWVWVRQCRSFLPPSPGRCSSHSASRGTGRASPATSPARAAAGGWAGEAAASAHMQLPPTAVQLASISQCIPDLQSDFATAGAPARRSCTARTKAAHLAVNGGQVLEVGVQHRGAGAAPHVGPALQRPQQHQHLGFGGCRGGAEGGEGSAWPPASAQLPRVSARHRRALEGAQGAAGRAEAYHMRAQTRPQRPAPRLAHPRCSRL